MAVKYPDWVNQFAKKYFTKNISQFILHKNINDFIRSERDGKISYLSLKDFLNNELFKHRDIVVAYDRATGISFKNVEMKKDFLASLDAYDTLHGTKFSKSIPKNPVVVFAILENYFKIRINDGKSIAFILDHAETLVPMSGTSYSSVEDRTVLVYLQKWAQTRMFLDSDVTITLLSENIVNLNQQFVSNPYTFEIEIPYPIEEDRLHYIQNFVQTNPKTAEFLEMPLEILAKNTAGLGIVHLKILLSEAVENKIQFTNKELNNRKKEIIESEANGLLEFVETKYNLDNVAGHKQAKLHLRHAAKALQSGRQDVMPMGYLISGPVGTGKTFIVSCFASDVGVPMVKLKNFRSQWQGVTEGNLEKVLHLLEAMTPVAVMIDEADAYLGNRSQGSGDSGVSSRVFSMIASFMSNTNHRGKIIWFLMTARPDLLPVDLKRQGRAEEHIALFYPETLEDKKELFQVMLKKTDLEYVLENEEITDDFYHEMSVFSGADMEAALTRAKFKAVATGKEKVDLLLMQEVFDDFLPPTYPEEIELMNLVAVLECTSRELLPEKFKTMGRDEIVERVEELKMRIK